MDYLLGSPCGAQHSEAYSSHFYLLATLLDYRRQSADSLPDFMRNRLKLVLNRSRAPLYTGTLRLVLCFVEHPTSLTGAGLAGYSRH